MAQIRVGGDKYALAEMKFNEWHRTHGRGQRNVSLSKWIAERHAGGKVERPDGALDAREKPLPWSFRMIAPALSDIVGFYVSHEAVRVWCNEYAAEQQRLRSERTERRVAARR